MFKKRKRIGIKHLKKIFQKTSSADKISIENIMNSMNAGGFGLVLMFFSLPILIPLPPPLPSLISLPLIIFSLQMIFGLNAPKLPKIISKKSIERQLVAKIIEKASFYLHKIEKIMKPRLLFLSIGIGERFVGLLILIFSGSILIPLPFTNFIPGIGILITSFGLMGRDGMIIILGLTTGLFGTFITFATILLGAEFINQFLFFN